MAIDVEKIKENIGKAADFTVQKTEEVFSSAKLKVKKVELKRKISGVYKEIGEVIYTNSKTGNDITEQLEFLIKKIDEYNEEISRCNEALNSLDD